MNQKSKQSVHLCSTACDVLLDTQEVEERQVGLFVETQDALPVHAVLALLVQSVEREERWVEAGQQDRQQQGGAAHHTADGAQTHTS